CASYYGSSHNYYFDVW
nr:immunoglobulin heavy chain junction region [Mus musculus]